MKNKDIKLEGEPPFNIAFDGEFSWEILLHIPLVYEAHLNGLLGETRSTSGTKPFYYFSDNHVDNSPPADCGGKLHYQGGSYDYDYEEIFAKEFDLSNFKFPPYKEHYSNLARSKNIHFSKPVVAINNKSLEEWGYGQEAQNRIEIEELEAIVKHYHDHDIIYIRANVGVDFPDTQRSIPFNDKEYMRTFENVYVDEDLSKEWNTDFNTTQLIAHSLAEKHFSVAGGNAFICAFFGGTHTIKRADIRAVNERPVWHTDSYLKNITGSKVIGVTNRKELIASF